MPKVVCTACQTEYHPKKNGVIVIEMAAFGVYKVYNADLWVCWGCGNEIVAGFGQGDEMKLLRADHYQEDFETWLTDLKAKAKANDTLVFFDYEKPHTAPEGIEELDDDNGFSTSVEEMKDDPCNDLFGDS